VQGERAQHHAVGVGIEPIARAHRHALNLHGQLAQSQLALFGRQRHGRQRSDADCRRTQLGHVAHTTVYHHPGPAVALRGCG